MIYSAVLIFALQQNDSVAPLYTHFLSPSIYFYTEAELTYNVVPILVDQRVKNPPAVRGTWVQSLGWEDPPEKGMDIHSNILAWSSPWTEEPGGLQSLGSQRDGHDQPLPHSHAAQLCTETFFLPYSFPVPFIPEY